MSNLSKLQKKYMQGLPLDVGVTHKYNVIAAIRKKFIDFDYFLVECLGYPNIIEYVEEISRICVRLTNYLEVLKNE